LLVAGGLDEVSVTRAASNNHYHPWKREIRLHPKTHDGATLSALATAAHEVGHAQQFAERIWRCRLRFVFWPVCWAMIVLLPIYAILCFAGASPPPENHVSLVILTIGALLVLLQLPISLPLESDATRRARKLAADIGLLANHELAGFDRVLNASWKTYVAAEVQRWIVLTSIALATAGYLWYESYQHQLFEQMSASNTLAMDDQLLDQVRAYEQRADELSPQTFTAVRPVDVRDVVYEPQGWGDFAWLIHLSPLLLVFVVIMLTLLKKPKAAGRRKLTIEEKALQSNNTAGTLHAQGKHEAAIAEYTRAIKLNPQLTAAWYNRGQMYFVTARLEEALHDFDAAVRLAPHYHDALVVRGHTRLLLEQEDLGLADLETVLSQDPTNEAARIARAEYWHLHGEFERAIADWTEAVKIDPACSVFYRNRGLLYYLQDEYDRAISDQTEAIRLDPSDAVAWNNRGAARLKRGDWAEAAADLREAVQRDPKLPNSYRHLAWLQATCPQAEYRDGNEAVAQATRALELTDWKQSEWLEALAAAHAEAGNFDEAARWQRKCLDQSSPETRAEQQARLELYEGGQPFHELPADKHSLATS
jgi:tetratricopeptide (TPR) repeat protein